MSGRQTTRGEKEQAACGVRGGYGPVCRGQQQDHAAKEVGPGGGGSSTPPQSI